MIILEDGRFNSYNNVKSSEDSTYLTLYETNEVLKQLPKILSQMKNIILNNTHNLSILQSEVKSMKDEQEKFRKDVTRALNIISSKFSNIDQLEDDLKTLDQALARRISDIEDEIVLTQQITTKNFNEVLKFKEHWKI
ncbi:hypothetical protein [Clostridium sartagoforme]|uniref:hypothetical protein n=1 Tax=Clostridium sartagoforme TaxID=84031 RepID=UPI003CCA612F